MVLLNILKAFPPPALLLRLELCMGKRRDKDAFFLMSEIISLCMCVRLPTPHMQTSLTGMRPCAECGKFNQSSPALRQTPLAARAH